MVAGGAAGSNAEGGLDRQREAWHFSVLMEEPSIELEEAALCGKAAFFHLRVLCHERRVNCGKYAGCKEYCWQITRRFSDFLDLDTELRSAAVLPDSVVMPRKTLWRHLCPTMEFAKLRSQELHRYLNEVLGAAEAHGSAHPGPAGDAALDKALPQFLGLEPQGPTWALPPESEVRQAALIYSLDKGVYMWAHHRPLEPATRFLRFDRKASLGDLCVTFTEVKGCPSRRRAVSDSVVCTSGPASRLARSGPWSPRLQEAKPQETSSPLLGPVAGGPLSALSSPDHSRLPSPAASPPQSCCHTPRRSTGGVLSVSLAVEEGDECSFSLSSVSTADTEAPQRPEALHFGAAVWLEVDLDAERLREEDHRAWWERLTTGRPAQAPPRANTAEARQQTVARLERTAALFRELSVVHEDLNLLLAYGIEGKTMAIAQQATPLSCGLRATPFTPQRCHRVLGQALKALGHLHDQMLPHGHVSPESLLIEEGPLGPQVRLAWTPGQRRPEGHVHATLGFRGPGPLDTTRDVWAFACVALVWWAGFQPAPHPWTQFARSRRLKDDIHEALAMQPPERPKVLLDLHSAAATAEEPGHSFLALLASLLTRCLSWEPAERPKVHQLLAHPFFEQAL